MNKFIRGVFFAFFCSSAIVNAQTSKAILITTNNISLVLTIGANNRVYQSYLGKRLLNNEETRLITNGKREVYITGGMEDLLQPAIRLIHSDHNPSLELKYVSHATKSLGDDVSETTVQLQDPKYPVQVILHYQAFNREDIIKVWTEIKNDEKGTITLQDYASCMLHLEAKDYWLTQFHGDWASEMKMQESKLTSGVKEIDSKLGTRADMYQTPVFFLALNKPADETTGELIAGTLAWTGNFKFHFEIDERNALRIIPGINSYASAYELKKGETFTTPAFIFTYSVNGKGQASRNLHKWARNYGVLDGNKPRLTLLNNWEATHVNFDEKELVNLFDDAEKTGYRSVFVG
ncbi:glycoside hydrolase family 36 N-terminal domain-containing protein [Mucilaginibacter sp. UC70_90]